MALVELLDDIDVDIIETFQNPVLFNEFIENFEKFADGATQDDLFEFTNYQKEILLDFNNQVELCCARSVGKTKTLKSIITWAMVYNVFPDPEHYVVAVFPGQNHLEPVFNELVKGFRLNPLLKQFIAKSSGVNNSDHTIRLLNGANLLCRIAGNSGDGRAVNGLHSPFVCLDESSFFPWGTWLELLPVPTQWEAGWKLMVAGVPDGRREKSVCYHCDQENSMFSKHRVTALQNPRFTDKDYEKAKIDYGGEDSDDFGRFIFGRHGKPVTALFDRSTMTISDYPVYKLKIDGKETKENLSRALERLSVIPSLPNKKYECFFGVDLGFNDPTAIYILYFDDYGTVKFHAKIEFDHVTFPIQERLLDYLDTKYNPLFIGIDRGSGGQGISFTQHFFEDKDYQHKDYIKRMIPITFNESISLGIGPDGKELTSKVKPYSVEILQSMVTQSKIIFTSTDLETITELERMTYTKTPSGDIVYRTLTEGGGKQGSDHYTAALLCAVMAKWIVQDSLMNKPKRRLLTPKWFR